MARRANRSEYRGLTEAVRAALGPLELVGLHVDVRNVVAYLEGTVPTPQLRDQAEILARQVPGIKGVVNELVVEPIIRDRMPRSVELDPLIDADVELQGLERVPGTEPDLNADVGTNDPAEAADGGEPYDPPNDPVVQPIPRVEGDLRVLGGFSRSAMDGPIEQEDHPAQLQRGDDQIAEEVRLALAEDAATTDLRIYVTVRRGVVHLRGRVGSIEDAELAEEVASRVPGVADVAEELDVEGL